MDGALAKPRSIDQGSRLQVPNRESSASFDGGPPKEMIVIEATSRDAVDKVEEPQGDAALSDAAVELMASKSGLGPLGFAVEVAAAIEVSSSASNAPKQSVRMGPAPRTGVAAQRRAGS